MAEKIITLCYRKVIDVHSTAAWDKYVFEDSHAEFKMQSQYYNQEGNYQSFSELLQHSKGAEKLHFLVSGAITGYINQLNGVIPDILDNLGRRFLAFEHYKFELINSHIYEIEKHKIAINFFSKPLIWHQTIGDLLVISNYHADTGTEEEFLTNIFKLQPFLSIYSLKNLS